MPILRFLLITLGLLLGLYVLALTIGALTASPKKQYSVQSTFHRWLLISATAAALKLLRIRICVTGGERLPREPVLFVGNHISNYDPIVTWYAFRERKIGFVSKPSNFKIPLFGRIIRRCCFLPIDRENPRNAIESINEAAKMLSPGETDMAIYPEGTRSRTGQLLPFHNGVFKIAKKAGSPVAVVRISGTDQIHKNWYRCSTEVILEVLEVIPKESVAAVSTGTLGAAVTQLLKN